MSVQTQKLRAVIWPLLSPETGLLYVDRFAWPELEKANGEYDFAPVRAALGRARSIKRYAIVHVEPFAPAFCADAVGGYIRLIEALGKEFGGEPALLGLDVCCPGGEQFAGEDELADIARAFAAAFPRATLFAPAESRISGLIRTNKGIIVTPENVERVEAEWPRVPLRMAAGPKDAGAIAFAAAHHVSILESRTLEGCNAPTHIGHRFAVRSVTVDDSEKGEGAVKVSMTVANTGTLPCYRAAEFMLRLNGSDVADSREYPMALRAADVGPGCERTAEITADVTGLARGEYDVHVGLFLEGTGYSVPFGIEGRISDGYYEGRLILTL